jgi:Pin2-interacting protein X1
MLGIGMQHQKDSNGIAWRQQRDFENLLRRLNDGTDAPGPFCKAYAEESESLKGGEETCVGETQKVREDEGADEEEGKDVIKRKEKKKRKRGSAEEPEEDSHGKKRRKKRKKSESKEDGHGHAVSNTESEPPPSCPPGAAAQGPGSAPMNVATAPTTVVIRAPYVSHAYSPVSQTEARLIHPTPLCRPRTHRARMIAAKRMASSNSNALAEILGIPSSSASSLSSPYPSTAVTPTPTPIPGPGPAAPEAQEPLQQITTSSQSVGDYFKAKLSAKQQPRTTLATADAPASAPLPPPTPSQGDDDDHNRAGLGLGCGGSRAPLMDGLDERVRCGIGASSSKFAAMFTLGQPVTDTKEENAAPSETRDAADRSDECGKSEKKRAKEERRRKKKRRRRRAEAGQLEVDDAAVDMPIGEAPAGQGKKKKRHELAAPDGYSQDAQPSSAGGIEVVQTKRRKRGDKDKKSAKHRRSEE